MKRKNWKRTAAFVTSMTMATTMMPAELGSILVKAVENPNLDSETAELNWDATKYANKKKSFITELKVNGTKQTNLISNSFMSFDAGNSVEITSEVPLKFTYKNGFKSGDYNGKDKESAEESLSDETTQKTLSFNDYADELNFFRTDYQDSHIVQEKIGENEYVTVNDDYVKTKIVDLAKTRGVIKPGEEVSCEWENDDCLNVVYVYYETVVNINPALENGDNTFVLPSKDYGITREDGQFKKGASNISEEAALAEVLIAAGYSVTDETFTAVWDVAKENVIVTFAAKETKNSDGTYTYSFTMPDDNSNDTADSVTVGVYEAPIKVNFYESEEKRTEDQQAGVEVWTSAQENDACDAYFGGTVISSSNNPAIGEYSKSNSVGITGAPVIVGDTVTITAANPFVAHISDGNNEHNWINATNSFEKGQYKSVFTMPKYNGSAENGVVVIDIVKIEENYTYKVSGNKLLADADTGSFKDAEAAKIVAKYYDDEDGAAKFGTNEDNGKEITGAVPNGKYVVVAASRAGKITAADITAPFKVTKNGAAVSGEDIGVSLNQENGINTYKYTAKGSAGTYNAVYTVKGTDGKTYDISYSFRIAAKDELTAEDVKFTLSAKENNAPIDLNGVMASAADIVKERGKVENGEVVTFMLANGKAEEIAESGNSKYQFTVDPNVLADGYNKFYVKGTTSGSTLGRVYEFTIYVTDPEYGGSVDNPKEIPIKWRVVSYDEIPRWANNRFEASGEDDLADAQISIDEIDDLEEILTDAAQGNEAAKKAVENKEVRYQWIKAPGANRTNEVQDELDEFKDGLPTELGDYTVYIIYDDVIQATVDVTISKYNLGIYADESDLTYTYGHKFELAKPTVQKDADGEVVNAEIDNLKCSVYKAVEKEVEGTKVLTKDDDPLLQNVNVDEVGQLNAGHYYITFTGKSSDEDYVVKEDPQLLTVNQKSLDDPSIIILIDPFGYDGQTHDVVQERDPSNQSNFTVRDTDFDDEDPRYDISDLFKITEGGKQSTVGAHDCTFTLVSAVEASEASKESIIKLIGKDVAKAKQLIEDNGTPSMNGASMRALLIRDEYYISSTYINYLHAKLDGLNNDALTYNAKEMIDALHNDIERNQILNLDNANNDAKKTYKAIVAAERTEYLGNFEGKTVDSEWHITADEANEDEVNANLQWNNDNTTLYDNGRIHLEITRNADDKINKDKTVAKIAKFGVVVEKEGKIAAPVDYDGYTDDEVEAAEKFLKVGMANADNSNGFIEGGYTKTSSPVTCASQTYKVNIKVKDVETGVWARPYVLYEDGTVSYGPVKYLDLTNEAIDRLNVWTANSAPKAVRKADLDKYQASSEALIKANVKSGYNTAENKFYVYSRYVDLETAGFTGVAQVADFGIVADRESAIDAPVNAAAPTDAEKEAARKALKKDTAKVVGHYNKANAVLKENEYAASIKLGNAATGCWVRTYVDLGNGLVIYNDPIYINSASEYYGNEVAGELAETKWEIKAGNDPRLVFKHADAANANGGRIAKFAAKAGVAASDVEVVKTGVVADKNNLLVKDNKMVLDSGFIDGVHRGNLSTAYSAKLTPNGTNDVSVRTYTIFKIKGADKDVEVTVYGDVTTYEYDENLGRVVKVLGDPSTDPPTPSTEILGWD